MPVHHRLLPAILPGCPNNSLVSIYNGWSRTGRVKIGQERYVRRGWSWLVVELSISLVSKTMILSLIRMTEKSASVVKPKSNESLWPCEFSKPITKYSYAKPRQTRKTSSKVTLYRVNIRLVSSIGRAPDCCAGGQGFEPQTGPTLSVFNHCLT